MNNTSKSKKEIRKQKSKKEIRKQKAKIRQEAYNNLSIEEKKLKAGKKQLEKLNKVN